MAHRLALNVGPLCAYLRKERIRIFDVNIGGANPRVPLRAGDQHHGDAVTLHDTEIVLLLIDAKAQHIAVMCDSRGDVVERQLRHGLPHHARNWRGSRRVRLVIGLAEP
jgi:hypothetical protein